ncbi:HlyD family efflux transporter periplasmic adaptor subunit [Chitinophaga oryziterrae]|uniref:HlyD family efflux transporter periplasmic adaptor subunit n=2 Tax=Chitinophaga oryziterrae TaxID=1031224 RepID=A0A6N8JE26_9BACT|nr:HlyD family efflux transporter periplasmic adaptor subunit [Chitinophaga oryziterrae]
MHPQIIRDKPGNCPICGMTLVKKGADEKAIKEVDLNTLLKPTNGFVVSSIPVITIQPDSDTIQTEALGTIAYDTRMIGNISARVSGRIEKLYLRYNFQDVRAGQKVMDIYSPELMTDQQNLLFLLKNDPTNTTLINAAKERLLLLGVTTQQLQQVIQNGKSLTAVSIYSNYSGHIHDPAKNMAPSEMRNSLVTRELDVREGMYVQQGQPVFSVYNAHHLWALLNIYTDRQSFVKVGNKVQIIPETAPEKSFLATIDFIEPVIRKENKTITARVVFDNSTLHIPVGSQVKALIRGNAVNANWLPKDAIISLGLDKIVFLRSAGGFKAHKVETGLVNNNKIEILKGLSATDSVAENAQYLADSESFIKVNN